MNQDVGQVNWYHCQCGRSLVTCNRDAGVIPKVLQCTSFGCCYHFVLGHATKIPDLKEPPRELIAPSEDELTRYLQDSWSGWERGDSEYRSHPRSTDGYTARDRWQYWEAKVMNWIYDGGLILKPIQSCKKETD